MKRQRKHHKQCRQPVTAQHVEGRENVVALACGHYRSLAKSYPVGKTMHCPDCWLRRELDTHSVDVQQQGI